MENTKTIMRDDGGARLQNIILATLAGVFATVVAFLCDIPNLDPSLWTDAAIAEGIYPPRAIFPGVWRLVARGIFAVFGVKFGVGFLAVAGDVVGGVIVALLYLVIRQVLALLIRTWRSYDVWRTRIAPFCAFVAALFFGFSDPFLTLVRFLSSDLLHLLGFVVVVHLALRWFVAGGRWRLFPMVGVMGVLAAETPYAFALPVLFVGAYAAVWHAIVDAVFPQPENLPSPSELPKWRMFFLFLGALGLTAYANILNFVALGGVEANGWGPYDVYFRYASFYWRVFAGSASIVGWVLGLVFGVLPLVIVIFLMPRVVRDDRPMPFNLGVLLFLVGMLALMQSGAFPAARFWTFTKDIVLVRNGFLLAAFACCSMVSFALFLAAFTFECQRTYLDDDAEKPGVALRFLVPALTVVALVLSVRSIPKSVEREMQAVVDEAVAETVRECDGAKFLFTDGHLDAALELCARGQGKELYAFNMMAGSDPWQKAIRTRPFAKDSDDYRNAEMGVPALLRVWAGEKPNGMDGVALQLGFEFWKREQKPLPTVSGLVAREKGFAPGAVDAGVAKAKALAQRILALAPKMDRADPSPALSAAYSAVAWRLARLARLRDDVDLADELDQSNTALKKMLTALEYERLRTFMQLTPREGLEIALKRADFIEARRYAASVLRADEDSPEANFGMGMSELKLGHLKEAERYLSRCLKRRPDEPAVLNNLSIICRKLRKYKEAEDFARRAIKILPDSPEVKQTLEDALKKAP